MCWLVHDGWGREEARRRNWDYSKGRWIEVVSREQTFPSSKHTAKHPSAHTPPASIRIHQPFTSPTCPVFILPPVTSIPICLPCLLISVDGIQQFLKHTRCQSPQIAIHLLLYLQGAQGACAGMCAGSGWLCGWVAARDTLRTTWCACVPWQA